MPDIFIGTDLEDISRIRSAIEKNGKRFLNQIYTREEQTYCQSKADPAMHFAGRFCAKEAMIKALKSSGVKDPISWTAIEIEAAAGGEPRVNLHGKIHGACRISISHTRTQALAFALYLPGR